LTTAWHTRLTALFGMRVPILGGGLMGLSDAGYVSALVRAGCMAFITPRSFETLAAFEQALVQCRQACGAAPFGVNLTLSNRLGANAEVPAQLALALAHGVRHFETIGPSPWPLFERIHDAGGVLVHKCAAIDHALKAESHGADAIALVGPEAGGHPGMNELSAQLLGALALDRLQVPLALGGGIGSGRQIASALALGCEGVVIGTRFLVGDEVAIHPIVRQRLLAARAEHSVLRLRPTGHPWRVLDNATAREVAALEAAGATRYEDFGARVQGRTGLEGGWRGGDADAGLLSMGAGIGFANRAAALACIVGELMDDTAAALDRVARLRQSAPTGTRPS
jgi:nitronate monooxygenase